MDSSAQRQHQRVESSPGFVGFVVAVAVMGLVGCVQGERIGRDTGPVDAGGGETGKRGCAIFGDGCPDGQNCYQTADGTMCRAYTEDVKVGDTCQTSPDCGDGQRCFEQTCRRLCDPSGEAADWSCVPGKACMALKVKGSRLDWGVCEPREDRCTSWPEDDCPEGQNCYAFEFGLRCRAYSPDGAVGDSCRGSTDCNGGQVCVNIRGEDGRSCRERCNQAHPCESGRCQTLNKVDYGACLPTMEGGGG